jgi:hypothetical protein
MGTGISLRSADEAQTSSYGLLEEDDYLVRIDSFQSVRRPSQFAQMEDDGVTPKETFDFILQPLGFADAPDTELVDQDGEPLNPEKHLVFFYDPNRLGTRPMISRSRQFLASALGVPADGRIELPEGLPGLIGKELIATVGIKNGKNNITGTRPAKKRTRVRTSAPAATVEETAATEDELDF